MWCISTNVGASVVFNLFTQFISEYSGKWKFTVRQMG